MLSLSPPPLLYVGVVLPCSLSLPLPYSMLEWFSPFCSPPLSPLFFLTFSLLSTKLFSPLRACVSICLPLFPRSVGWC